MAPVVPVGAEAEARTIQAHAPTRGPRNKPGKIGRGGAEEALRAAVGEDLHAARPVGEKRQRLLVVHIDALHPNRALEVVLRHDRVVAVDIRIEVVVGEKFRRRCERGVAEEVLEIASKRADRDLADALQVVLQPGVERAGAPRLDADVAEHDLVAGLRILGVGQGDAPGVLVVVGPADRRVDGGAGDEIFADVEADVQAGKPPQVFLLRLRAAIDEGELRHAEGVAGGHERHGPAVGAEYRAALGVALHVAGRIGERALGLDVGLLEPDSAHDLEPVVQELQVAAHVGGGNELLGPLGQVDGGSVRGVGVGQPHVGGIGFPVAEQGLAADSFDLGETIRSDAAGKARIDERGGEVVARGGQGRARHTVAADKRVAGIRHALVAGGLAEIDAGLEREGNPSGEVAAEAGVGGPLGVIRAARVVGRGGDDVTGE